MPKGSQIGVVGPAFLALVLSLVLLTLPRMELGAAVKSSFFRFDAASSDAATDVLPYDTQESSAETFSSSEQESSVPWFDAPTADPFFQIPPPEQPWPADSGQEGSLNNDQNWPVCGNGIVEDGEECDGPGITWGEGPQLQCGPDCRLHDPCAEQDSSFWGWLPRMIGSLLLGQARNPCFGPSSPSECGNGRKDPGEDCDPTVPGSTAACTLLCKFSPGQMSTFIACCVGRGPGSPFCYVPKSGDGYATSANPAVCAGGSVVYGAGGVNNFQQCQASCLPARAPVAPVQPVPDPQHPSAESDTSSSATSGCNLNGQTDPGEQCDDGPNGSAYCNRWCERLDVCYVWPEQTDLYGPFNHPPASSGCPVCCSLSTHSCEARPLAQNGSCPAGWTPIFENRNINGFVNASAMQMCSQQCPSINSNPYIQDIYCCNHASGGPAELVQITNGDVMGNAPNFCISKNVFPGVQNPFTVSTDPFVTIDGAQVLIVEQVTNPALCGKFSLCFDVNAQSCVAVRGSCSQSDAYLSTIDYPLTSQGLAACQDNAVPKAYCCSRTENTCVQKNRDPNGMSTCRTPEFVDVDYSSQSACESECGGDGIGCYQPQTNTCVQVPTRQPGAWPCGFPTSCFRGSVDQCNTDCVLEESAPPAPVPDISGCVRENEGCGISPEGSRSPYCCENNGIDPVTNQQIRLACLPVVQPASAEDPTLEVRGKCTRYPSNWCAQNGQDCLSSTDCCNTPRAECKAVQKGSAQKTCALKQDEFCTPGLLNGCGPGLSCQPWNGTSWHRCLPTGTQAADNRAFAESSASSVVAQAVPENPPSLVQTFVNQASDLTQAVTSLVQTVFGTVTETVCSVGGGWIPGC